MATFHTGGDDHGFKITNTWFGGTGAVVGFLFISGFSIAWSLEQKPDGFLKRRFWRIYPVYALCLLVPFALGMIHANGWAFAGYFLFLQGVIVPQITDVIGVSWSLAAEWWMYVLAPWLKEKWIPAMATLGMVVVATFCAFKGWRAILYGNFGVPIIGCAPFWLAGFGMARFRRSWLLLLVAVLACVVTFYFGDIYHLKVASPLTAMSGALAVFFLPRVDDRWVKVCNWLGDVSYPLYLVHMIILEFPWPWYACVPAAVLLAMVVNEMDRRFKQTFDSKKLRPAT